ncbi:precorrin-6Y C5,15-methyltransferase (decarboxylating) subunit CbiT [Crassaminicella thermophila]|uniref:Precorrin-6Y C5,15-methyltransferase (Decarboxylating) subunit CbiT n=1 Tax=Crassaminicella thermophila TaxID=2599308 RepID=A0A5C0SET9_CRATE|nr:precorrin-6Y C5,15-methyltransferase (decarboxylating) subunit CbiT [Crassaminicella thermophila]QEK11814.1 precorrin-6Y C5,15-methyltransferase (decarboxylating) subunit CbiT [Crassaminicella thermophila]
MKWKFKTPGIPDKFFIRGNVPMTKEEVRAVTLSKLRLRKDSIMVDVGAGTGSIAIEAAHVCTNGEVIAIEKNSEGIELIKQNSEKFGVYLKILHGNAAECLKEINKFDRVIIGGSGGELEEIIKICYEKLTTEGICVINCITIETLYESMKYLKEIGFSMIDVVSVNVSRGKLVGRYTLMEALNPIYIISGIKTNLL